jgi:hypothetical protein
VEIIAKNVKVNENYKHSCDSQSVNIDDCHSSLAEFPYTAEEYRTIVDFYISHAPILKNEKENKGKFQLKSLTKYEWKGSSDLNRLERQLLTVSNIPYFCILKSDCLDETLEEMKLSHNICVEHPRAVFLIARTVKIFQNGEIEVIASETRVACLFRHIRNALCHNCIYKFENDNMLLEDYEDTKVTAKILINYRTLLDWIDVVNHRNINTNQNRESLNENIEEVQTNENNN